MTDTVTTQNPVATQSSVATQAPVAVQNPVATATAAASTQANEPEVLNLRQAYDKTLQASLALAADSLLPVNVDLPSTVTTAVGSLSRILALRDRVKDELPKFDLSHFELLEQYALAAAHAHGNFLAASAPPEAIVELNQRGTDLRDTLYRDAVALAGRGLISGDRIGDFKANVGYKNITYDLIGLASLLRQNWDKISSRTAIQLSELDDAEALAGKLISALSAREQISTIVGDVAVQRQRNFTLFATAYDQVRRAIGYLRWNDEDAERIAPSLYGGRVSRKKADDTQPGTATGAPPASGTSPSGTATTGTAATTASGVAPTASVTTTSTHAPSAAAGTPSANPFAVVS